MAQHAATLAYNSFVICLWPRRAKRLNTDGWHHARDLNKGAKAGKNHSNIRRGLVAHEHVATDPSDGKHGQLEGGGDACLGSIQVDCINMASGTEAEENT